MDDRYLYFEAVLQGQHGALPPAAVQLLADLLAVARDPVAARDHGRFAEAVLAALSTHPALAAIGRVCLAQQAPDAPLLHILGAANRVGITAGDLVPGYHCFIADGSSLTTLAEGRLRAFTDAAAVVASFEATGRPPQRTIRLVSAMGMRAGLCLPLVQAAGRGYLFLNTTVPGTFDRADPALAMPLAFLVQLARSRLHPVPASLVGTLARPARPFSAGVFAAAVDELVRTRWGVSPGGVAADLPPMIWSLGPALAAVRAGIEALAAPPSRVAIRLTPAGRRHVDLELLASAAPTLPRVQDRVPSLAERLAPWAVTCLPPAEEGRLVLRVPADQDFHHETGVAPVAYSI
jgi:hypothetical protein